MSGAACNVPSGSGRCRRARLLAHLCALPLVLLPLMAHGIGTCTVTSSGVALGGYTFNTVLPTDATGNIEVSCSLIGVISIAVLYEIRLSAGANGSYAARQMGRGANRLGYNLYLDPLHAAVWGDGTAGTATVSDSYLLGLVTTVRDYPLYARAPAGQNTPAGVYTDMITVTVAY